MQVKGFELEFHTPTNALLYITKYLPKMFTLKHLKTLQHVSIIIQIIFREFICSLLKLLILKFVKNLEVNVVMRQHNCKWIIKSIY